MITDLLGSPSPKQMCHLTCRAVVKELLSQEKPPRIHKLYHLSSHANHYAVHLLLQLFKFDPVSDSLRLGWAPADIISLSLSPRLSASHVLMHCIIHTLRRGVSVTTPPCVHAVSLVLMVTTSIHQYWSPRHLYHSTKNMRKS